MHKPIKYVEKGLTAAARGAWVAFDALNSIKPNGTFIPRWSDLPLQKSWQKVKPPLGWPRETDSLCPNCVREARQAIVDGKREHQELQRPATGLQLDRFSGIRPQRPLKDPPCEPRDWKERRNEGERFDDAAHVAASKIS